MPGKPIPDFPFDAVLWDMDGTLIDSEPIWIEEEELLMRQFGVEWSEEDALICLGGPMERVDEYMRSRTNYQHQPFELSQLLIDRMTTRLATGVSFAPGAQSLFDELHQARIPMALVTASTRPILDSVLNLVGRERFGIAISNDDVVKSKPDPEGYLSAALALGVSIDRTLILEDSVTGASAALATGAYVLTIEHMVALPHNERTIRTISLSGMTMARIAEEFSALVTA